MNMDQDHLSIKTNTISGLLARCDAMQNNGLDTKYAKMFVNISIAGKFGYIENDKYHIGYQSSSPEMNDGYGAGFGNHGGDGYGAGFGNHGGDGYGRMNGVCVILYECTKQEDDNMNIGEYWLFALSGGFIVSGKIVDGSNDSLTWIIDDAVLVERWGTVNGIGQLRDGPLSNTIYHMMANGVNVERCQCAFRFKLNTPLTINQNRS
jgi:hypothetical protein